MIGKSVEIQKRGNFLTLPPVGAYVAEIKNVRVVEADKEKGQKYDTLEMMVEITEGEYAGRYTEVYNDQKERFGKASYRGTFRLYCPNNDSEEWVDRKFANNIWCVQESNPGYEWDRHEEKLKGKKVGISVRRKLYTYNNEDRETTEIGQFETVADVKAGKCRPMKDRDQREKKDAADNDEQNFTDVSKGIEVPWG